MAATPDRDILRRLAARVRAIAELPLMAQRRQLWRDHNALRRTQALVLCFPEGSWCEILPAQALQCVDPGLREWEASLRQQIWWWDHIRDDNFIEPYFNLRWRLQIGTYGFAVPMTYGDDRGSYVWDAPIKDLAGDLPKLHFRSLAVDRAGTGRDRDRAEELFGDILPVRLHAPLWWTVGLTGDAAKLVGLENLMFSMCDQPARVHELMRFLRDEQLHFLTWCEREGLLTPNNGADYVGSGGVGCTAELVASDRLADRWGFAESQETVGISRAMFEEFVLPYQVPLLERFGLNCYGCCEGLENRIEPILQNIPRLRRVSVAPTANQELLAGKLAGQYIFSRKPHPAPVCVGFNEPALRADLRHTLTVAREQPLELILKDTHTLENAPERLTRWVQIARDEIARAGRA